MLLVGLECLEDGMSGSVDSELWGVDHWLWLWKKNQGGGEKGCESKSNIGIEPIKEVIEPAGFRSIPSFLTLKQPSETMDAHEMSIPIKTLNLCCKWDITINRLETPAKGHLASKLGRYHQQNEA